jgi:hypothetical protein
MLSKEEVLEIMSLCKASGMTCKQKLRELGVSEWRYYSARRYYLQEERESGSKSGEFIELSQTGQVVPAQVSEMKKMMPRSNNHKASNGSEIKIECQTAKGNLFRMSGRITPAILSVLLESL